jgi:hypothetical protein
MPKEYILRMQLLSLTLYMNTASWEEEMSATIMKMIGCSETKKRYSEHGLFAEKKYEINAADMRPTQSLRSLGIFLLDRYPFIGHPEPTFGHTNRRFSHR